MRDVAEVREELVDPGIIGTFAQLFQIVGNYQIQLIAVCIKDRCAQFHVQTFLDMKTRGLGVVDGHCTYEEESGRRPLTYCIPAR